ncbi:hypothetical protein TrVE_jg152 [Triparma verrucosa]|uniref:Uncharacterized protein n=1 Tax=Triparma verrucosa TaxID=1606542 RepID=A0A9W7CCW6_9STRA|nr:hypothetical protein TrVE_jg152 [Triparma verrucosa]
MSSGLLPPPGVGLMVSQRGGDDDFGDGDGGGDVVVTDSFLRTIRGETRGAGRARGAGRGGRVGRDEEVTLVDDENGEELDSAGSDFVVPRDGVEELRDGGWEEDGDDEVGSSRAISGGMGIASSAIGSALMAAGMIREVDGLGQVYGMGGEEEEEDDAINEDMARLGMSSTGGAGRKGRETTTRRKARKKGAGTVGVGGKGGKEKQDTTESTLRLRVDGQRHAIRALEKVIADLKKQLSRKKGGKGGSGSGGANVVSPERRKGGGTSSLRRSLNAFPPPPPPPTINHYQHEIGRTLRNDLSTTLKQNKTLQVEVKKLKEQLKESKEKEERGREITLELKRYSNKLRNELEELREELINKGDELDIAKKERKRVSMKVGKKKTKQLVEEKERREKEAEVRGENITQEDINKIKRDIMSLKQERKNDREVIEGLNREANGLRHRLAIISKKR